MPIEVIEAVARDLFPRARRVALGCAAEPLIHPRFQDILALSARYRVPDLWFPTNLLALTEAKAEAMVEAGVSVVAASVDGFTEESYEKIRVGARWELFLQRLQLLALVKRRRGSRTPRLRLIFTWMQSNRDQLPRLPEFAARHGADEIDVRYVVPTDGVDNAHELLSGEDPAALNAELAAAARDAVGRGLRLASYPEFDRDSKPRDLIGRLRRRAWHIKAGLDRLEYRQHAWSERWHGCAYPGRTYVVRPNGAVFPCQYWDGQPIGFYPEGELADFVRGEGLVQIRQGLRTGRPVGTCQTCSERRDAFYRPFNKLKDLARETSRAAS